MSYPIPSNAEIGISNLAKGMLRLKGCYIRWHSVHVASILPRNYPDEVIMDETLYKFWRVLGSA